MITLTIDQDRIKDMARRLSASLAKNKITLPHQTTLQLVSQTLFGKPYEEIKETLLQTAPVTLIKKHVTIIRYCGEHILMLDDTYITSTCQGTDMEISLSALQAQAKNLAAMYDCNIVNVTPPKILGEEASNEDIMALVEKMGYFKPYPSIFTCFSQVDSGKKRVLINDNKALYSLNGEFELEMEAAADDGDDPLEHCIWMPETSDLEGNYEFFFSFNDICSAVTYDEGKTWIIHDKQYNNSTVITFI